MDEQEQIGRRWVYMGEAEALERLIPRSGVYKLGEEEAEASPPIQY